MFNKIDTIIDENKIKFSDCEYHTRRDLEDGGKVRVLVVKGEQNAHVEYICPKCKHYAYKQQKWESAPKKSKVRFMTACEKCGFELKLLKMKGTKK